MKTKFSEMKGISVILLIMIVAVILIVAIVISAFIYKSNNKNTSEAKENKGLAQNIKYEEYYNVVYKSNYGKGSFLKTGNNGYEIVDNYERAREIFKKISHKEYIDIFNADFFENNNLVFFDGKVGAEVQDYTINDNKIEFLIYNDAPLTSMDEEWDFNIFFVPTNKDLTDIDIECEVYPNRLY